MWFLTIRSAFWLDETISYCEISGGFWEIWARQRVSFPTYFYMLSATKPLIGSSEVAPCCRALKGLPVVICQDTVFDYLYVNDLAKITEWFIEHEAHYKAYNVCTGVGLA
jgi:hypothetical protein